MRMTSTRLAAVLALLLAGPAGAAVFTVTKTVDTADGSCDEDCSLREALLALPQDNTNVIHLPAGTYRLTIPRGARPNDNAPGDGTNGNLVVTRVVRIIGAGRDVTTIDARPSEGAEATDRVLSITISGDLTISGVTITGGKTGPTGQGGGIINLGGGLTMTDVAVIANRAGIGGGGILAGGNAETRIRRSLDADNVAGALPRTHGSGGGIQNIASTMTIEDSTISGNTALLARGGGIQNLDVSARPQPPAILTITGTTISDNFAGDPARTSLNEGSGGGVFNSSGRLLLENSTVTGNEAVPSWIEGFGALPGSGRGGGVAHQMLLGDDPEDGTTVIHSTIAYNTAFTGSQVYGFTTFEPMQLANALVAGGAGATPNCASESGGVGLASLGGNLGSDASPCFFDQPGDQPNTAPGIDAGLADNGGPTETIALLGNSHAIGAGLPAYCPPRDQRGALRPSPCAAGAVEAPEPGAVAGLFAAALALGALGHRGGRTIGPSGSPRCGASDRSSPSMLG
jgi:CSLREA domain-containing protein